MGNAQDAVNYTRFDLAAPRGGGVNPAMDAIIYYTHFDSLAVRREVHRLQDEVGGDYDIFVVGYCRTPDALAGIPQARICHYLLSDLMALPYPKKLYSFNPEDPRGNHDLALLRFCLDHPEYERYWIIEYDVRLSGHWSNLFAELAQTSADLLCTTMMTYHEFPQWMHWQGLSTGLEAVPAEKLIKGFLPFSRVSKAAVDAIDGKYRANWAGHPEVVWPTAVGCAGLTLEDIGGYGRFTPGRRRGRYYTCTPTNWAHSPGTFVYRPIFADGNLFGPADGYGNDTLWHPVK